MAKEQTHKKVNYDNNDKTLGKYLNNLKLESLLQHGKLTLVPLRGQGCEHIDYLLGAKAIKKGIVKVTEIDESGSVPELAVINKSDKMILFLDGEELVGAKQNRILNISIMLSPHSKTVIPVSCVEQGRWHSRSSKFDVGSWAPAELRASKIKDVAKNIAQNGCARTDQREIWNKVSEYLESAKADSPTMAMHDVVKEKKILLEEYIEMLQYPENTRGVIVIIDNKFEVLDLFDKPETLKYLWPRLIKGYAMDAITRDESIGISRKSKKKSFSKKAAEILLEHIGTLKCNIYPSVGIGEDWRFEAYDVIGQGLIVENICVHLSVFPNDGTGESGKNDERTRNIAPPSRRRQRYRGWNNLI